MGFQARYRLDICLFLEPDCQLCHTNYRLCSQRTSHATLPRRRTVELSSIGFKCFRTSIHNLEWAPNFGPRWLILDLLCSPWELAHGILFGEWVTQQTTLAKSIGLTCCSKSSQTLHDLFLSVYLGNTESPGIPEHAYGSNHFPVQFRLRATRSLVFG